MEKTWIDPKEPDKFEDYLTTIIFVHMMQGLKQSEYTVRDILRTYRLQKEKNNEAESVDRHTQQG